MLMLVQQTWLDDLAQKPNVLVTTGASERFKLSLVGLHAPVICDLVTTGSGATKTYQVRSPHDYIHGGLHKEARWRRVAGDPDHGQVEWVGDLEVIRRRGHRSAAVPGGNGHVATPAARGGTTTATHSCSSFHGSAAASTTLGTQA